MNFHPSNINILSRFTTYNPGKTDPFVVYDGDVERITGNVQLVNWRHLGHVLSNKNVCHSDRREEPPSPNAKCEM